MIAIFILSANERLIKTITKEMKMRSSLIIKLAKIEARKISVKSLREELAKNVKNDGDSIEFMVFLDALEYKIGVDKAEEFIESI